MTKEKFEEGLIILRKIDVINRMLENFTDDKFVHLHIKDHYGNDSRKVIKTYAFGAEIEDALTYGNQTTISDAYGEFLSKCRIMLVVRRELLQDQFKNL